MKRFLLVFLSFFFVLNLFALNLKKSIEESEHADAKYEVLTQEITDILLKMSPSNILKCSWIGEDGGIGSDANPKCYIKGNQSLLSFGILLEIDTGRYMKEVFAPLKALLDKTQNAKLEGVFDIQPLKITYSTLLVSGANALDTVLVPYDKEFSDKSKIVYTYENKQVIATPSRFFQGFNGEFMLLSLEGGTVRAYQYNLGGDDKLNLAVRNAIENYAKVLGKTKILVKAVDEDDILLGISQEIPLNTYDAVKSKGSMNAFNQLEKIYANTSPIFITGLFHLDPFEMFSSFGAGVATKYLNNIYTSKQLLAGKLQIPKEDLEAVVDIRFEIEDGFAFFNRKKEYIEKIVQATIARAKVEAPGEVPTADEIVEARKTLEKQFDDWERSGRPVEALFEGIMGQLR